MRRRIMAVLMMVGMVVSIVAVADAGIELPDENTSLIHMAGLAWQGHPHNIDETDNQLHKQFNGNYICAASERVKLIPRWRWRAGSDYDRTEFDYYVEVTNGNGWTWNSGGETYGARNITSNSLFAEQWEWHKLNSGTRRLGYGQWVDEAHIHMWYDWLDGRSWEQDEVSFWFVCVD